MGETDKVLSHVELKVCCCVSPVSKDDHLMNSVMSTTTTNAV